MDDISFVAKNEAEAHRVLRDLTEKLREDGLTLNSGKTKIFKRSDLKRHLLIVENALIDKLKKNVTAGMIDSSKKSLESLWAKLDKDRSPTYWEKVIGRVYALAGEIGDPFLVAHSYDLLILHPKLHQNIFTYFESIPYSSKLLDLIEKYLESGFDLYEEVRVRILECLIVLDLPKRDRARALSLAWKCFLNKLYQEQEYSRAAALLVIAAYGTKASYRKLKEIYESDEQRNLSQVIRRYLAAILLSSEKQFHDTVLERATYETGDLVKDLSLFAMHSKTRTAWDAKTMAAFRLNKKGFSVHRYIPIRKVLLLGILTHHPDAGMRKRLVDEALAELKGIGVTAPRKDCRTDELLFEMVATRR